MHEGTPHELHAWQLIEAGRAADAEQAARRALAVDPESARGLAALACSLMAQDRLREAREAATAAVAADPDDGLAHRIHAFVLARCNRGAAAAGAAREALRLDGDSAENLLALAVALAAQCCWREALDAVDRGLTIDPREPSLLNLRTTLLVALGRDDEIEAAAASGLREAPDDADSHVAAGYAELAKGDAEGAIQRFREALRLEPEHDGAREGAVMALRARYRIYAMVLAFWRWLDRFGKHAIKLIILAWVAAQILRGLSEHLPPAMAGAATLLLYGYLAFVILTWVADPLFNAVLFAHPLGRLLLSRSERRDAAMLSGGLVVAVGMLVGGSLARTFGAGEIDAFIAEQAVADRDFVNTQLELFEMHGRFTEADLRFWVRSCATQAFGSLLLLPMVLFGGATMIPGPRSRLALTAVVALLVGLVAVNFVPGILYGVPEERVLGYPTSYVLLLYGGFITTVVLRFRGERH